MAASTRRLANLFDAVHEPQGGAFGERSALLHLPPDRLARVLAGLRDAAPAFSMLAADPSLRGAMQALTAGAGAVHAGRQPAEALVRPMNALSDMLDGLFGGRYPGFSWRLLMEGDQAGAEPAGRARQLVAMDPKLDFKAMQPGRAATQAIDEAARELRLAERYDATLRLIGRAPLNDAQFMTLSASAISQLIGTAVAVLAILIVALRSVRVIAAVFITLALGFALTAAVGLLLVGAFNLISVAFAILFVGLGADFGIQYAVRYRAERYEIGEISAALYGAARKAGGPLALAAATTAVGFFCFLPTEYRGVAELGEIAGAGMLIAFATTMTLLPALLTVLRPSGEKRPMGFTFLASADRVSRPAPLLGGRRHNWRGARRLAAAAAYPVRLRPDPSAGSAQRCGDDLPRAGRPAGAWDQRRRISLCRRSIGSHPKQDRCGKCRKCPAPAPCSIDPARSGREAGADPSRRSSAAQRPLSGHDRAGAVRCRAGGGDPRGGNGSRTAGQECTARPPERPSGCCHSCIDWPRPSRRSAKRPTARWRCRCGETSIGCVTCWRASGSA